VITDWASRIADISLIYGKTDAKAADMNDHDEWISRSHCGMFWKKILELVLYEIILATLRDGQSVNPHAP
jgi:hypothetical protein